MLGPGDSAPSFSLDGVADPWSEGTAVLVFFKVTCPVCQLAAPKVQALADGGGTVSLFDPCLLQYFWLYVNNGLKLVQLRFYQSG